jgi:hypothetical protein
MTLYHFTAEHLARKISREGITKGAISLFDQHGHLTGIERGWIWLTDDGGYQQSWATRTIIPYSRTAVRFTVELPALALSNLRPAIAVLTDDYPNSLHLLNWPGSHHWWLYHGKIFRKWLIETHVEEFTS